MAALREHSALEVPDAPMRSQRQIGQAFNAALVRAMTVRRCRPPVGPWRHLFDGPVLDAHCGPQTLSNTARFDVTDELRALAVRALRASHIWQLEALDFY